MPVPKFWAYVKMIPVLQARESISAINEFAYAFGSMKKESSSQFMFNLNQAAQMAGLRRRRDVIRPSSPAEMAALAGASVAVVMQ